MDYKRGVAAHFPLFPAGWYHACTRRDLDRGPKKIVLGDDEFVVFRAADGAPAALANRCVHLGADLSRGCVVNGRIRCPFHEWEFARDGRCVRIPAADSVPDFARQLAYPTHAHGDFVFICNRVTPPYSCPFFDDVAPGDLCAARPFTFDAELPWYMVAANGFDMQHFRAAHNRTLIGDPIVDQPTPKSMRISAQFAVTGAGVRDAITRRFSGRQVTMTITSWCGTTVLAKAQFQRTTSYGYVSITPLDAGRTRIRTIVWVPRRASPLAQAVLDPIDAAVRRLFIRAFLRDDQDITQGIRYTPGTLIDADAVLKSYLDWLAAAVT